MCYDDEPKKLNLPIVCPKCEEILELDLQNDGTKILYCTNPECDYELDVTEDFKEYEKFQEDYEDEYEDEDNDDEE